MKLGRELDALVAEKVMGCSVRREGLYGKLDDPECGCNGTKGLHCDGRTSKILPYSTDIAAVWGVVEKISEDRHFDISDHNLDGDKVWTVGIYEKVGMSGLDISADTAPHAICLAALASVGYEMKS